MVTVGMGPLGVESPAAELPAAELPAAELPGAADPLDAALPVVAAAEVLDPAPLAVELLEQAATLRVSAPIAANVTVRLNIVCCFLSVG